MWVCVVVMVVVDGWSYRGDGGNAEGVQLQELSMSTHTPPTSPVLACAQVVREVALIVYDEIHYLRDRERGVVWEESIILAPPSARFAFLSATIPNASQFAGWIAQTHGCAAVPAMAACSCDCIQRLCSTAASRS